MTHEKYENEHLFFPMITLSERTRMTIAAAAVPLLVFPCLASAASFDAGFDFRATSAYVTDPAGSYFVGATAYPTTSDGITYGWTSTTGLGTRNRSTSVDPRLAGVVFRSSGTSAYNDFRVDLPAPGAYEISIALGDVGSGQSGEYAEIYDGTTLLATVNAANASQPAGSFFDMQSNLYTMANFFTSEVPSTLTFSTTQLIVRIGTANSATGNDTVAWLHVTSAIAAPAVTTTAASSITASGATLNGSITDTGGADAMEHGFAYSTDPSLSTGASTSTLGAFTGTGAFTDDLSSLSASTAYYYRAYVTNSAGTSYGSIQSFTTSSGGGGGETADWYDASWGYRVKVTVDHTKVGSDLTDFPVYVDLSELPAGFFSHVRSDGGDIRVTEYDGTTEVSREVVSIDTTDDSGELYFMAPSLSSTEDTGFYIYYGNAAASDYATTDTYGRDAVWSNGYAAVYHLQESAATAVASGLADSLGGPNATITTHSVAVTDVDGKIGHGLALGGSGTKGAGIQTPSLNAMGISAWFTRTGTSTATGWNYFADSRPTGTYFASSNSAVSWGQGSWTVYVNGVTGTFLPQVGTTMMADIFYPSASPIAIFDRYNMDGEGLPATVSEIRIYSAVPSAAWISTSYANQDAPSSFYAVGAEESSGDESGGAGSGSAPARVMRLFAGYTIRLVGSALILYGQ